MTSPTTSPPSSSSDLEQALLALRDLLDTTPGTPEPAHLSAVQQAKTILRRHRLLPRGITRP
jgi:hypothetical protein